MSASIPEDLADGGGESAAAPMTGRAGQERAADGAPAGGDLPQVCVCYLMRRRPDGRDEVLLGRKKKGLGLGKYVAPGGKVEPGERIHDAMAREVLEEVGLAVAVTDLSARGVLTYLFPHRPAWSQQSSVFVTRTWSGRERESDELAPEWFPVDELPLHSMWDDAKHWLPGALAGEWIDAVYSFGPDNSSVMPSGPVSSGPTIPVVPPNR